MPVAGLVPALLPLAFLVLLGWVLARAKDVNLNAIATILVYAITPVVAFGATAQIRFEGVYILLPAIACLFAAVNGISAYKAGKALLRDRDASYLMPIVAGAGNNGYFGVPLAAAVFAPDLLGIYFLIVMGVTVFESTLGYYFIARGHLPFRQALRRVAKLPTIYAIVAGVAFSAAGGALPDSLVRLTDVARGGYVTLGMMLIGLALGKTAKLKWEPDFIALSIAGKYLVWLGLAGLFIALDTHVFGLFSVDIHKMFLILAVTPVAANSVAYAAENNFRPELAATVVFITTVLSCLALPFTLGAILALA